MSDEGYYHKYNVERVDEGNNEAEVHKDCDFFVLDLTHDVYALRALEQYRVSMIGVNTRLAADLAIILGRYCNCIDGRLPAPECPIHGRQR